MPRLTNGFYDLFEGFLNEQVNEDNYRIILDRFDGLTLQSVAEKYGVTRERIRQKEFKYLFYLNDYMVPLINRFIDMKGYITIQDVVDIYDNDDFDKILVHWCKHNKYINYLNYAELFLPSTIDLSRVGSSLAQIAEEIIGEGTDLKGKQDEILGMIESNGLYFMSFDAFVKFISCNGYRLYKTYAIKGKQSYGYMCARMIAKYFPSGIKLYDSTDLDKLREIVLEEFGDIGLSEDNRALSARIIDYTVLSGRGSVIAPESIQVDLSMLEDIKEYIDSLPEAQVYYSDLYAKFEGVITMMSNIDNYNFLHGVLKLYYADEYDFSRRDYLSKRGAHLIRGKMSDRLNQYVVSAGKPLTKDEILKKFPGLTDIVLSSAINTDPYFYQWDNKMYYSTQLIKHNNNDLIVFKSIINDALDRNFGYCSDAVLYDLVQARCPMFLESNGIVSSYNLFYTFAKLFGDLYDFRRPHICRKGLIENICFKNVALYLLGNPDVLDYLDYQAIVEKNKWSLVTAGMSFYDIGQDYIRISSTKYVKKTLFCIDDNTISCIKNLVISAMKYNYLSLLNYDSFDSYPSIGYEWNTFLLRSVIDNYIPCLSVVEFKIKDRRYEKSFIVDAELGIRTYVELVAMFLKENSIFEITESKLNSVLILQDLTYRIIPQELYESNNILEYKDGVFRIVN